MVMALSEAGERAAALGVAAAAALVVWLLLLAVLALATRPDLPGAGPATSEFGGPESPAVVSLLVNRWEVGREAVPATLLDLAAKGVLAIEQVAPGRFICRLRDRTPAGLAPYEQQVLGHIRRRASGGVVPCEALTTGPEEESSGWWERFRKAVVADARKQGLSRGRWSRGALVALAVVAVVPSLLAAGAFVAAPTEETGSEEDDSVGAVVAVGAMAWFGLMAIPYKLRAERDTPAGKEAAARWLGLREFLDGNESFDRAPPAAVALWDRYLAYGAAMGVAAGAVRALPLGSESDREAWSAYGGHWHVVRVRYPQRIPPGWGQRPVVAAAKGGLFLVVALLAARGVGIPLAEAVWDFLETSRDEDWRIVALVGAAIFGVMLCVVAVFLLRSAAMFGLAVADLFAKVHTEGLVIRLRGNYLAVDDGERRRVRAWRVEPAKLAGVGRGSVVRVTTSRWLGYVFAIERVGAEPEHAGLAAAPVATDAPAPVPLHLDLDAVERRTGVRLRPAAPGLPTVVPGADQAFVLEDGRDGRVLVVLSGDHHPGTPGAPDLAGGVLRWIGRRGGAPVDGVEGDAAWAPRRGILTVTRGDRHLTVMVGLPRLPPEQRLDVARALADTLL